MEGVVLVLAGAVVGCFLLTILLDHLADRLAPVPVALRRRFRPNDVDED